MQIRDRPGSQTAVMNGHVCANQRHRRFHENKFKFASQGDFREEVKRLAGLCLVLGGGSSAWLLGWRKQNSTKQTSPKHPPPTEKEMFYHQQWWRLSLGGDSARLTELFPEFQPLSVHGSPQKLFVEAQLPTITISAMEL